MRESEPTRLVNIAVVSGPALLLLRRAWEDSLPGYWEIPGGGVEPGESFEAAARRELVEETGIRAPQLLEFYHSTMPAPKGFRRPTLEVGGFLLQISPRPDVKIVPGEHSAHQWVAPEDLRSVRMMELNRSIAELAWAELNRRSPLEPK
jgi:8-oxo-dGTP diphosphatase